MKWAHFFDFMYWSDEVKAKHGRISKTWEANATGLGVSPRQVGPGFLRHAFAPKDCCLAVVKALLLNFQRWSNTHDCWIIALGFCEISFCLTVVDLFFDTFEVGALNGVFLCSCSFFKPIDPNSRLSHRHANEGMFSRHVPMEWRVFLTPKAENVRVTFGGVAGDYWGLGWCVCHFCYGHLLGLKIPTLVQRG